MGSAVWGQVFGPMLCTVRAYSRWCSETGVGNAVPKFGNAGRMDSPGPFPTAILCIQFPHPSVALSHHQVCFLVASQPSTRVSIRNKVDQLW